MTLELSQMREPATVWTTPAGAPERLIWRGRRYRVDAKPIPWIDRVLWWQDGEAPAPGAFERRMWQVQARALDTGELQCIDLEAAPGSEWHVTGEHA